MPTYHYRCDACGAEFEKEQRISEAPVKKCASCGKNKARRMIVSGNFILKGGGWYSDGYGSGSGSKTKSKSTGSGGGASSKNESSSSTDSGPPPSPSSD